MLSIIQFFYFIFFQVPFIILYPNLISALYFRIPCSSNNLYNL